MPDLQHFLHSLAAAMTPPGAIGADSFPLCLDDGLQLTTGSQAIRWGWRCSKSISHCLLQWESIQPAAVLCPSNPHQPGYSPEMGVRPHTPVSFLGMGNQVCTHVQARINAYEHTDVQTSHQTNLRVHPQICIATVPDTTLPTDTHPLRPPIPVPQLLLCWDPGPARERLWVLELLHFLCSLVWQLKQRLPTAGTQRSPEEWLPPPQ